MNRVNCIDPFLKKAEADEPVYITDVRETFDREGSKAFHVHAHLYEGETAVFATRGAMTTSQPMPSASADCLMSPSSCLLFRQAPMKSVWVTRQAMSVV